MRTAARRPDEARSWLAIPETWRSVDIIVIYHTCPAGREPDIGRTAMRLRRTCNNLDRMLQVYRTIVH
ncbi:hypothetical protein WK07_04160 [Burkholderia multivorans]|nr:hypothetical protein WK07_04160 [Burkholderia multivorans]KWF65446.1 hypothetical protein WL91_22235 [Burkholderia multivorans]